MAEEQENRRRVGVYDRPASADRPRAGKLAIIVVVVVIAVVAAVYWLR